MPTKKSNIFLNKCRFFYPILQFYRYVFLEKINFFYDRLDALRIHSKSDF